MGTWPSKKPAYTSEATWWLVQQLQQLEPGSSFGGTYANKRGYHNIRKQLPSTDYSVQLEADKQGRDDLSAAIDWTFPDAQEADYDTIIVYSDRLLRSGLNLDDTRLDGWREFYGQADLDRYIEGYDFQLGERATADKSHLWHIHLSELRENTESFENKEKLLAVLKGESLTPDKPSVVEADMPVISKDVETGYAYDASGNVLVSIDSVTIIAGEWANSSGSVPSLGKATLAIATHYGEPVRLRVEYATRGKDDKDWWPRIGEFHDLAGDNNSVIWLSIPDGSYAVSISRVPFNDVELDGEDAYKNVHASLFYAVKQ